MKRLAIVGAVLLVLVPACAARERPEGIVERWLLSLNQGAAGRPGRYAQAGLSQQLVPGWDRLDPGRLDTIEVGAATPAPGASGASLVPFRIVDVDGGQVAGVATVGAATPRRVTAVQINPAPPGLEGASEGSRVEWISARGWLAALGVAAILSSLAVGVVVLVRRTVPGAPGVT